MSEFYLIESFISLREVKTDRPFQVASLLDMDLKVVKLSDVNKWALIKDGRLIDLRRHAKAESMLSRLRRLSLELAVRFKLKERAPADLLLRTIHSPGAEIVQNSNATVPYYVAVSYCWHNASWKPVKAVSQLQNWDCGCRWSITSWRSGAPRMRVFG
jgi:hypothetical protein